MPIVSTPQYTPRRRKTVTPAAPVHDHDADWSSFMGSVANAYYRHALGSEPGATPVLFETDAADLYTTFLHHLPAERLIHTCTACRRFVEAYGGLVTITPEGLTQPLFWDPTRVPEFYRASVEAVAGYVSRAKVTGVFLSNDTTWGLPKTGVWTHLAVKRPLSHQYRDLVHTPGQAMAAKREDYNTVQRALAEFGPAILKEALRILEADAVNRAEKFVGPVKWLLDLHWASASRKDGRAWDNANWKRTATAGANRVWRAVATAPNGYCHIKAGVIGMLLEDIKGGMPFEQIRARFNTAVHGINYQRTHTAPAAGNVLQAEKLVEKLGIARSLERRFARLDELELIWSPAINWRETLLPGSAGKGGVFSHLKTKGTAPPPPGVSLPRQTMTWEKFQRTVLPTAQKIELLVPYRGSFCAMLTAAHADAPNILKWDNTFSHYVYHHEPAKGHTAPDAAAWGLKAHAWCPVTGITPRANMWGANPKPHLGEGVVFVLQGAKDSGTDQGNALFPEILRDELHPVHRTIEAYSKTAVIGGREEASACGLAIGKQGTGNPVFRVTTDGRSAEYQLDRWD
jgi:hypothetical protein